MNDFDRELWRRLAAMDAIRWRKLYSALTEGARPDMDRSAVAWSLGVEVSDG